MAKTAINRADLELHLDEQLGFLERSATAYDQGYEDEAKRLAVTLRVLLHETLQSHSLLGQLGLRKGTFIDTALPIDTENLMPHGGLVSIAIGTPRARYVAMLDDAPQLGAAEFEHWWNATVFVDSSGNRLTRKQLILVAANQDGGAHVGPSLDSVYASLSKENSLNWMALENGTARAISSPERAAIRQITHEVLKTLKAGYEKRPMHEGACFVGGLFLRPGAPSAPPPKLLRQHVAGPEVRPSASQHIGRNAPCPCGSGKRYKRCHGAWV